MLKKAKKEETAFQRSCRYMATQRYNLSVVRIDLNALDLQRREAGIFFWNKEYLYPTNNTCSHLWYKLRVFEHAQNSLHNTIGERNFAAISIPALIQISPKRVIISHKLRSTLSALTFTNNLLQSWLCLQVIKDYERAVIFRLGKLLPPKGPGQFLFIIILLSSVVIYLDNLDIYTLISDNTCSEQGFR